MKSTRRKAALSAALSAALAACLMLTACSAFGRKFNKALPEFMRSDPGAKEMEIISQVRRAREWSPLELKAQEALFNRAQKAFDAKDYSEATSVLEEYLDTYPTSRFDERGRFMLGQSHYFDDDFGDAFKAFKHFNDLYVVSDFGPKVMEYQYQMGSDYITGKHSFLFGIFSRKSVGKKYLEHVVERYPTGVRAPDAQWAIASYHLKDGEWVEASGAFQFLAENYKDSSWFGASRYYHGYCLYRQVKGSVYDPVTMAKAREAFEIYIREVPSGEWLNQAREFRDEMRELEARHILEIGEWYVDQGKPYSARYYLESVRVRFPVTESAREAVALLQKLGARTAASTEDQKAPAAPAPESRTGRGGS